MVSAMLAFLSVKVERLGKHSVAKLIAKEEGIQRLIWAFLRPKMPNRLHNLLYIIFYHIHDISLTCVLIALHICSYPY